MEHNEFLGAGDYTFHLNPNANYKTSCIQTGTGSAVIATDYDLTINDVRLYIAVANVSIPDVPQTLYLKECQLQSKTITGNDTLEFTVPSSTELIAIFVQSSVAGSNTLVPPSQFICLDGSETNLQSLQCTYRNKTLPSSRWASLYSGTVNQLQQRYFDTQNTSTMVNTPGGADTYKNWIEGGPVMLYSFYADKANKSTNVQLQVEYSAIESNAKVFIAAYYTRSTGIVTQNGQVVSVQSLTI